jgi:perosamine synthetase
MIPIAKPFLGKEEIEKAGDVIASGWITQGPKVAAFENQFAAYVGAKHACAVSNGTTALHLALLAADVKPGNVVITVSHSFIATANSIRHVQAEPVFVDIDLDTFNISVEALQHCLESDFKKQAGGFYYKDINRLISQYSPLDLLKSSKEFGKLTAIMVVHQLGMPCDLKRILPLAKKYNVPVIEDAACASGSEISLNGKTWEKIGRPHGAISCFSFHPRKVLTTGEGGMITTNNTKADARLRLLRQHGMSVSDLKRTQSQKVIIEEYNEMGFNDRLTDIQAAIGIEQLKKLPAMVKRRREIAQRYFEELKNIPWIISPLEHSFCRTNWQSFPVRISDRFKKTRDQVMQYCLDREVATRPGVMNIHQEKPYRNTLWKLPNSEKARQKSFILPMYQTLSDDELDKVITILKSLA